MKNSFYTGSCPAGQVLQVELYHFVLRHFVLHHGLQVLPMSYHPQPAP